MPLADFRMEKFLGRGAYGAAYRAVRLVDGRVYAVKEMNVKAMKSQEKQDTLNEIRVLASVYHPNILAYYETFLEGGKLYIVTELAQLGDLEHEVKAAAARRQHLPEEQVWCLLIQILLALRYLHSRRILHRDLKAGNIFKFRNTGAWDGVSPAGPGAAAGPDEDPPRGLTPKAAFERQKAAGRLPIYKLADFGISRVLKESQDFATTCIGTPYNTPAEMWKKQPYNEKCDVYSLGTVIYEVCTGRHPFEGRDMGDLARNVLRGKPQPIGAEYSEDLRRAVTAMMRLDPARRPSVRQLLESPAFQRRMHLCPTPLAEEVLPEAAQALAGTLGSTLGPLGRTDALMQSYAGAPTLLSTIRLDNRLLRAMNDRPPGPGQPRPRGGAAALLPAPAYATREKWNRLSQHYLRREARAGGAGGQGGDREARGGPPGLPPGPPSGQAAAQPSGLRTSYGAVGARGAGASRVSGGPGGPSAVSAPGAAGAPSAANAGGAGSAGTAGPPAAPASSAAPAAPPLPRGPYPGQFGNPLPRAMPSRPPQPLAPQNPAREARDARAPADTREAWDARGAPGDRQEPRGEQPAPRAPEAPGAAAPGSRAALRTAPRASSLPARAAPPRSGVLRPSEARLPEGRGPGGQALPAAQAGPYAPYAPGAPRASSVRPPTGPGAPRQNPALPGLRTRYAAPSRPRQAPASRGRPGERYVSPYGQGAARAASRGAPRK